MVVHHIYVVCQHRCALRPDRNIVTFVTLGATIEDDDMTLTATSVTHFQQQDRRVLQVQCKKTSSSNSHPYSFLSTTCCLLRENPFTSIVVDGQYKTLTRHKFLDCFDFSPRSKSISINGNMIYGNPKKEERRSVHDCEAELRGEL